MTLALILPWQRTPSPLHYAHKMLSRFFWLPFVTRVTYQPFALWNLEVKSITFPHLVLLPVLAHFSPTTKESDIMCACRLWSGYHSALQKQTSITTSYVNPAPSSLWEYHLLCGSVLNLFTGQ